MKHLFFLIGFLLFCLSAFSIIKGKVTDTKGEPIPGTNVYWLNTTVGTVTDAKGDFQLNPQADAQYLVFSNIAYNADTVLINKLLIPFGQASLISSLNGFGEVSTACCISL